MKTQKQKQNESNLRSSINFFNNQESIQNNTLLKILTSLFIFPVLLVLLRFFGVFKAINLKSLLCFVIGWFCIIIVAKLILKIKPFSSFVKYLLAFSSEILIFLFSITYGFHVFILYLLVPVMSCLYFNKKFSLVMVISCYFAMIGSLAYRAFFVLGEYGFNIEPMQWFSSYCVTATIGYIVISFAIILIVKRNRNIIYSDYNEIQKNLTAQNTISSSYVAMLCEKNSSIEGHLKRCCDYVRIIVNYLQSKRKYPEELTDETAYQIISCSLLHDIGIIKVPDKIMDKTTALTPEDRAEINKHTIYGEELLRENMQVVEKNYLDLACDMVLCHHENFDGTGYPNGLKGEEIPLAARIMAVANGVDVLLNGTPTSQKKEFSIVMDEILQSAGKKYDPEIVNAVLSCQDLIREVTII